MFEDYDNYRPSFQTQPRFSRPGGERRPPATTTTDEAPAWMKNMKEKVNTAKLSSSVNEIGDSVKNINLKGKFTWNSKKKEEDAQVAEQQAQQQAELEAMQSNVRALHTEYAAATTENQELRDSVAKLQENLAHSDQTVQQLKQDTQDLQATLDEVRTAKTKADKQVVILQKEVQLQTKLQLSNASAGKGESAKLQILDEENRQLSAQVADLGVECDSLRTTLKETQKTLQQKIAHSEEGLSKYEAKLNNKHQELLDAELAKYSENIRNLQNNHTEQMTALQTQLATAKHTMEQQQGNIARLGQQVESMEAELKQKHKDLLSSQEICYVLQQQVEDKDTQLAFSHADNSRLNETVKKVDTESNQEKAKLERNVSHVYQQLDDAQEKIRSSKSKEQVALNTLKSVEQKLQAKQQSYNTLKTEMDQLQEQYKEYKRMAGVEAEKRVYMENQWTTAGNQNTELRNEMEKLKQEWNNGQATLTTIRAANQKYCNEITELHHNLLHATERAARLQLCDSYWSEAASMTSDAYCSCVLNWRYGLDREDQLRNDLTDARKSHGLILTDLQTQHKLDLRKQSHMVKQLQIQLAQAAKLQPSTPTTTNVTAAGNGTDTYLHQPQNSTDSSDDFITSPLGQQDNFECPVTLQSLQQEEALLVERLTALQQEKWINEEKIKELEVNNQKLQAEVEKKNGVIRTWVAERVCSTPSVEQMSAQSGWFGWASSAPTGKKNSDPTSAQMQKMVEEITLKYAKCQQEHQTETNQLKNQLKQYQKKVQDLQQAQTSQHTDAEVKPRVTIPPAKKAPTGAPPPKAATIRPPP